MTTDPHSTSPRGRATAPFSAPRRFTAARRLQSGFAIVALVVVGAGAQRAGWLSADAFAPESTLQTARVPVAAVRATAPLDADDFAAARLALPTVGTADALANATESAATASAASTDGATSSDASSFTRAAERTAAREARVAAAATAAVARDASDAVEASSSAERGAHLATGVASYYGSELAGRRTASGERFNPEAMTAAHRTLPLGTRIRVTNSANGKSVVVRVNDRGPFARGRILDLSHGAARVIGLAQRGHGSVSIERLGRASRAERDTTPETPTASPDAERVAEPAPDTTRG